MKTQKQRLRDLEILYKFLYFIRDIGVESAHDKAVYYWLEYMEVVADISEQGFISDEIL